MRRVYRFIPLASHSCSVSRAFHRLQPFRQLAAVEDHQLPVSRSRSLRRLTSALATAAAGNPHAAEVDDLTERFGDPESFGDLPEEFTEPSRFTDREDPVPSEEAAAVDEASVESIQWDLIDDDPDDVEQRNLERARGLTPKLHVTDRTFGLKMKKLIKRNQLRAALDMFQNQMLLVDRVQPTELCYNVLIAGCGRVGYTKMAFKLYNDMKKRGMRPKHVTYTSLLNACANGPSQRDGLTRLEHLRTNMLKCGYYMNTINYHALIKAYGRCGDIRKAFATADQCLSEDPRCLTEVMCNFLLQACISCPEDGFRHALLVWHQFRSQRITPSLYSYNLLLRAALECKAGDSDIFRRALETVVPTSAVQDALPSQIAPRLDAGELQETTSTLTPDLLSPRPTLGSLVHIKHLSMPSDRVSLLGGWKTVVANMKHDDVFPDIRTCSLLLNTLPPGDQDRELMVAMDTLRISPDVGFFNQLIKHRSRQRNRKPAWAALVEMQERGLQADIMTYGCLAWAVKSCEETEKFLASFSTNNLRPNVEILTTLLSGAIIRVDVASVLRILQAFIQHEILPDKHAIHRLELFRSNVKQIALDKERGVDVPRAARRPNFDSAAIVFAKRYRLWLEEVEMDRERHPFQQYKVIPLAEKYSTTQTSADVDLNR